MRSPGARADVRVIGRYAIYDEIASGGMATVHIGRIVGAAGFARVVAVKRMHPNLAKDPEFVAMFVDEAQLAARVRHPNVVATLDVVARAGELFVVMEYVHGESLASLVRQTAAAGTAMPVEVALRIVLDMLAGLHAAHEARGASGEALGIVHRDVSPQNVLVGVEGVARIIDFGVAKAIGRAQTTRDGRIKGKLSYMAPEQLLGDPVDRRSDVYATGVVLWELLAGRRLFQGDNQGATMQAVLTADVERPSRWRPEVPPELDDLVMRALSRAPHARFATARDFASALEALGSSGTTNDVADWTAVLPHEALRARAARVAEVESGGAAAAAIAVATEHEATEVDDRGRGGAGGETIVEDPTTATASVGDAQPFAAPAPRRKRWPWMVLATATVLGGVAVGARAVRIHEGKGPPTATSSSAPTTEVASTAAAAIAEPPASTSAAALADAGANASSSSAAARRPVRSSVPKVSATPPAPPATRRGCTPPYTVDASGVRTYKRECVTGAR